MKKVFVLMLLAMPAFGARYYTVTDGDGRPIAYFDSAAISLHFLVDKEVVAMQLANDLIMCQNQLSLLRSAQNNPPEKKSEATATVSTKEAKTVKKSK